MVSFLQDAIACGGGGGGSVGLRRLLGEGALATAGSVRRAAGNACKSRGRRIFAFAS